MRRERFDYSTRDSTHHNPHRQEAFVADKDYAVRVGIIREENETEEGDPVYIVEVYNQGKQVPLSCVCMSRFGGVHNFEEYRLRPWSRNKLAASKGEIPSASTYDMRAGDVVVVATIDGSGREGIILGGLSHPARDIVTQSGDVAYVSCFQGLETKIEDDGAYTVTFNGKPVNTLALEAPPTGVPPLAPKYNPLISGSFFGFDNTGSYTASDGDQAIKIDKTTTNITITSGDSIIEIGNLNPLGLRKEGANIKSGEISFEASDAFSIAGKEVLVQGTKELTLSGTKIAIGNPAMELLDTIVKIIDALGTVTVTSPVGTCTPIMASPQWAQVAILKALIEASKGGKPKPPLPVFLA